MMLRTITCSSTAPYVMHGCSCQCMAFSSLVKPKAESVRRFAARRQGPRLPSPGPIYSILTVTIQLAVALKVLYFILQQQHFQALTHYCARRGANYIDFSRDRFGSGAANVGQVQKFGAALAFGAFAALGLGMTFSGESTAAMGQRRKMSKKV